MPDDVPYPEHASTEPGGLRDFKSRHPRDIAEEIRDLPLARIREILRKLPDALTAEVISELPPDVQVRLFESMQVSNAFPASSGKCSATTSRTCLAMYRRAAA